LFFDQNILKAYLIKLVVFGVEAGWPFGAAECAVIDAGFVLVAGEVAIFAERSDVEPIAVSIEVALGGIVVPFDLIFGAKLVGLLPSFRFNA